MGLIVNLNAGTVEGSDLGRSQNIPVKIAGINEVTVAFGGSGRFFLGMNLSMSGTIDRVTGDVGAEVVVTDAKTGIQADFLLAEMQANATLVLKGRLATFRIDPQADGTRARAFRRLSVRSSGRTVHCSTSQRSSRIPTR